MDAAGNFSGYAWSANLGWIKFSGTSQDSTTYKVATTGPLAVTLADFGAVQVNGLVQVTWETVSELNNRGFNLYRNTTPDPVGDLLAYVPFQAPGSAQGFAYSYADADVQAGQTYWYWLEDVDLGGATTLHGPVSMTLLPPTAVRLDGMDAGSEPLAGVPGWWIVGALLAGAAAVAGLRRMRRGKL